MNQIPVASIVFMAVSACLALFAPLIFFLALKKRRGMRGVPVLVGAIVFPVFVFVLESGAASLLMNVEPFVAFLNAHGWAYALYGGLMAGLFEETGRLCAFYFLLKRRYNYLGGALSYGVGHGGIEAILLAGLPMLLNLAVSVSANMGLDTVATILPALDGAAASLAGQPPTMFLAGGVERVTAVSFHIAASVLVWMAATGRGHWGLYFLSILFHAATNFAAGLYQYGILTGIWLVEGITAAVVLVICVVTAWLYQKSAQTYTPLLDYNPANFGR